MAIQNRRGSGANYDPDRMVAGEFAVTTDDQKLYIAFGPGISKRVLTEEDTLTGDLIATDRGSGVVEITIA